MKKNSKTVIKVSSLSKSFVIPRQKIESVRGALFNLGRKKEFDRFDALKNVSFEVKQGEFLGIIGNNGSGKSTLLKILAGIYAADAGKVQVDGKISPFLELGVGFNPELTARENIYLNGVVLGLSRKQVKERFAEIIRFSELERFVDTKLKNYSSGMYVRLAFSVAIQVEANILLMDEVLAVGDVNFQAKCFEVFRKLKRDGKTIVFVSHSMSNVQEFCDRVILLDKGEKLLEGGPYKVINKYEELSRQSEEKRRKSEPVKVEIKKKLSGRKKPSIEKIEVLNAENKRQSVFERGEKMIVRIHYKNPSLEKILNFGCAFFDAASEAQICGNNTFFDKYNIKPQKEAYVDLVFEKLGLNKGEFFVGCSVFGALTRDVFDFRKDNNTIKVYPLDDRLGVVYLDHEWRS
ncbi:MAG: ABC transporter ATP-binding protein [Candidatus Gracilibacteria bacterium]|nr:ABC transporter ATP-binding protein [Candidatus Gracilibacteria bacterium]